MATLIRPPANDPMKSSVENTLELTQLSDIDPNLFTNTRPLWHPPGARGVYGGAVIAQCLAAAQRTVADHFTVHSMHCYFVLAGNADIPIVYHVERVRDGRSFATRTVQARQRAHPIFTVTISFVRAVDKSERMVQHDTPMPSLGRPEDYEADPTRGPFESRYVPSVNGEDGSPHQKRVMRWLRARGTISAEGGHEAHLAALAYMSDSFFIGTVARAHRMWRRPPGRLPPGQAAKSEDETVSSRIRALNGTDSAENTENRPEIGMMVSLDHTIYFHRPRSFRADDWLLTEMETPWAGDNRGLVAQHIWTKDGLLVATCYQEVTTC